MSKSAAAAESAAFSILTVEEEVPVVVAEDVENDDPYVP